MTVTKLRIGAQVLTDGDQCCFCNFDSRLFSSKFSVKAVSILHLSSNLRYFHKSSPNLLQEIYFLSFTCPKNNQKCSDGSGCKNDTAPELFSS